MMELRDADRGRDLMRHGGQQILVLAAESGEPNALDAERADAFVAEQQRHAEHRADLARTVEPRIETAVRNVLQLAVLDDPPADPLTARKALADVRARWPDRRADHEVFRRVVECEKETVLVPHRVADDPEQPPGEIVDVEHGADLRRETLQDRELPSVGLRARSELLEQDPRSRHVLDVLVKDAGDAAKLRRALRSVALDEA